MCRFHRNKRKLLFGLGSTWNLGHTGVHRKYLMEMHSYYKHSLAIKPISSFPRGNNLHSLDYCSVPTLPRFQSREIREIDVSERTSIDEFRGSKIVKEFQVNNQAHSGKVLFKSGGFKWVKDAWTAC